MSWGFASGSASASREACGSCRSSVRCWGRAMVALLGFVVTIGVLVVQQATGTLWPRFMRLWYRDLLQKVVLATFVGTLTLSLWLLRHVEGNSVPNIGVTVAGATASASLLLLLLLYLNRFTHSLRPVAVARMHDRVLVLRHSVGDFVPTGASVVEVFGSGPFPRARRLRRMFALGRERTIEQDPAFALRVLVDIAIGYPDETTALDAMDEAERPAGPCSTRRRCGRSLTPSQPARRRRSRCWSITG